MPGKQVYTTGWHRERQQGYSRAITTYPDLCWRIVDRDQEVGNHLHQVGVEQHDFIEALGTHVLPAFARS